MRINEQGKFYLYYGAVLLLALGAGLGSGYSAGEQMLQKALMQGGKSILFFRPAYEYYSIYQFINSHDEMKRLAGYYTLLESRHMNEDFLIDRYSKEDSPVVKRTILWILGYSEENEKIIEFYNKIFKDSPEWARSQILESLERKDSGLRRDFLKTQGGDKVLSK